MPKPLKKRPTDPNQWARQMVDESTAETAPATPPAATPVDFKDALSAYMSKLGAQGGRISGERRMKNLTKKQRHSIAAKAAKARWKKRA